MKNYSDKYLKYKLKYLKLKNQNVAGLFYSITNVLGLGGDEKKDEKQELFNQHKTLLEKYGIIASSMGIKKLRDTIKSIYLIEKYKGREEK